MTYHDWLAIGSPVASIIVGIGAFVLAQKIDMAVVKTQIKGMAAQIAENKGSIVRTNERIDNILQGGK